MDLILVRKQYRSDGIFGQLSDVAGEFVCETLEHAYPAQDQDRLFPKIPAGTFDCVRSLHELHSGDPFITFEITGVPGHSGLLFHWGNFNKDSSGCILLGSLMADEGGHQMILHSRETFHRFMEAQKGARSFTLTVKEND